MITDEHFETLQRLRVEARRLQRACVERTGLGSILHMALDPKLVTRPPPFEAAAVRKLRAVK